jgi:hypothetical protein
MSPTLHTGQLSLRNSHGGDSYTVILPGRILVCVSEVSALSLLRQGASDRDLECTNPGMRSASPQRLLQCSRATSDLPKPSSQIRRCNKASHSLRIALVRVGEHGAGYFLSAAAVSTIEQTLAASLSGMARHRLADCFNAAEPRMRPVKSYHFCPTLGDAIRLQSMSITTYHCWGAWSWVYACISAAAVLSTGRIGISSARARDISLSLAHCAWSLGSETVRLQDDQLHLVSPLLRLLLRERLGADRMISFLHLHVWGSVGLDFSEPIVGCRRVLSLSSNRLWRSLSASGASSHLGQCWLLGLLHIRGFLLEASGSLTVADYPGEGGEGVSCGR